jgi:hypothetical protein
MKRPYHTNKKQASSLCATDLFALGDEAACLGTHEELDIFIYASDTSNAKLVY